MERRIDLEISKLIGQPINYQLPVPVELNEICNIDTVEPGEMLWRYTNVDADLDTILVVDTSDGKLIQVKRIPLGETQISFKGLNSKKEYVLVDAVLASPDTKVLGRKKEAITRAMDKRELKLVIDGIEAGTQTPGNASVQAYTLASGDDLYDAIIAMKHLVEDYGDDYVLLVGSSVKEAIDLYDKDKAGTFNYSVTLIAKLKELGIKPMKIFGKVESTDGGGEAVLMNTKHMILVARNSRVAQGKPIWFVRRKISPEIAKLMGADVDNAQRALMVGQTPEIVDFSGVSANVLGFSVVGYESVIFAIPNPKMLVTCDATSIV